MYPEEERWTSVCSNSHSPAIQHSLLGGCTRRRRDGRVCVATVTHLLFNTPCHVEVTRRYWCVHKPRG
ncbi:hypothetical protein Pmani_039238 [Petrolisthes manimaculis]|uniref:Uncharacterized protein n=1 Tax=Petrolisthes manimaculis TaxID=1843537 RepID=A0AAE1NE31_9EUCA|nr:hypothetical protein Pmani_039238 [Petrolisthes manimaculis]